MPQAIVPGARKEERREEQLVLGGLQLVGDRPPHNACSALTNFIGLAKSQTDKKLTNAQAATFTTEAQTIKASLGC